MLNVKCGRTKFELNEHDEVMYNGACYQIITRRERKGWFFSTPEIAKRVAIKLIKDGLLVLDRTENRMIPVEIYKVNVACCDES